MKVLVGSLIAPIEQLASSAPRAGAWLCVSLTKKNLLALKLSKGSRHRLVFQDWTRSSHQREVPSRSLMGPSLSDLTMRKTTMSLQTLRGVIMEIHPRSGQAVK